MPSTGGRPPLGRGEAGRRAAMHTGSRRRAADESSLLEPPRRWNELLSSAAVILAGVLVVIGFGFVASRAMRAEPRAQIAEPSAPSLGQVTLPPSEPGLIPISPSASGSGTAPPSPSPSPSEQAPKVPAPVTTPPDEGAIAVTRGDVPSTVDLSGEGERDWVHWGQDGTFSLERDKEGGFKILEGAPTAPRFRHALSPQRFSWQNGDPVAASDGTPTGIRTCGKGNGFTLTAPAAKTTRTLKLYVGVTAGKGRLSAKLSEGSATAGLTLEQRDGTFRTAVLTVRYRAPETAKLEINWDTAEAFSEECGGVALQAASLR